MEFSYRLTGTGWAEATIADGEQCATITVSYVTPHALDDLLAAVTVVLGPSVESECYWGEEPGEHVWLFRRIGDDVRVKVEWYDDDFWREAVPQPTPDVVFEANVKARDLGMAVQHAAERVLAEYGKKGYAEKWLDARFPTARLKQLRAALNPSDH
jgi:hypothetical protein